MVEGFEMENGFDLDRFTNKDWILTNTETIKELSQFYSVFSNPTRLQIMMLLLKKDRCVGEIARVLNLDQSTVSSCLLYTSPSPRD
jgi:DNA-binding MarR family transcriptional regulator